MKEPQMELIAGWIKTIAENVENEAVITKVGNEVMALCKQFPVRESFV